VWRTRCCCSEQHPRDGRGRLSERIDRDLDTLFEFQADPEASAMAALPSRDLPAFLEHEAKIKADPSMITRTVVAGGGVVGSMGSWEVEGERDVGFWIGRDHWETATRLRPFARSSTSTPTGRCTPTWRPQRRFRRVLEKCGFVLDHSAQDGDVLEHVLVLTDSRGGRCRSGRPASRSWRSETPGVGHVVPATLPERLPGMLDAGVPSRRGSLTSPGPFAGTDAGRGRGELDFVTED
jgi:hypothetical protein